MIFFIQYIKKASRNWGASEIKNMTKKNSTSNSYTCSSYREEMILLSLQHRLAREDLSESERSAVKEEIRRVKAEMGMD